MSSTFYSMAGQSLAIIKFSKKYLDKGASYLISFLNVFKYFFFYSSWSWHSFGGRRNFHKVMQVYICLQKASLRCKRRYNVKLQNFPASTIIILQENNLIQTLILFRKTPSESFLSEQNTVLTGFDTFYFFLFFVVQVSI